MIRAEKGDGLRISAVDSNIVASTGAGMVGRYAYGGHARVRLIVILDGVSISVVIRVEILATLHVFFSRGQYEQVGIPIDTTQIKNILRVLQKAQWSGKSCTIESKLKRSNSHHIVHGIAKGGGSSRCSSWAKLRCQTHKSLQSYKECNLCTMRAGHLINPRKHRISGAEIFVVLFALQALVTSYHAPHNEPYIDSAECILSYYPLS